MAEPFGSGASASSSAPRRWVPRVVAGSLLVLQMAAPVAPDRGSRVHSQSAEDRRASVQVEPARGSSPDFRSRSQESSALSVLRSGSTAAQEAPVGSSPGAEEVVYAWASDRPDYSVVSPEERQELAVILDSMLISEKRDTGVPFEERIGHVDDPRVRELMQEIDTTLGGGIQWPDVHVTDGLSEANYLGFYYPDATQEEWSDFHDFDEPDGEFAEYPYGIHLSRDLVEKEFETGIPEGLSVRQTLVHELQHSMSVDNGRELMAAAVQSYNQYEFPSLATSEGRASLSMLVYAEMEQRSEADGPRLNELSKDDRQEVLRGVLQQYLVPVVSPPRDVVDEVLLKGLREERYLRDPDNDVWNEVADDRTTDYATGSDRYTPEQPFVPEIRDGATGGSVRDADARRLELATPLDELADRFAEERARSPSNEAEYHRRVAASRAAVGPPDRPPEREPAAGGPAVSMDERAAVPADSRPDSKTSPSVPAEVRPGAPVVGGRRFRSAAPADSVSDGAPAGRVKRFLRAAANSVSDLRMLVRPRSHASAERAGELSVGSGAGSAVKGRNGLPPGLAGVVVRGPDAARSVPGICRASARSAGGPGFRSVAVSRGVDVPTPHHRPVVVSLPSAERSERGLQR